MLTTDKNLIAIRLNELRIEADAERLARQATKGRIQLTPFWHTGKPVHAKKALSTAG
jgi:hypothetical protein